jgi:protein-L-isoaspartate O-methyltransferase
MNRADFIPDVIWTYEKGSGWAVPVDRTKEPDRWRELVDAEHWVITQVDDGELRGGRGMVPTSSSSAPDIMALMLDLLDPLPGMNVLEIGAGTGYNAALIAQRAAPGHVTTIEIDPAIAEHARAALSRTDLPVTVVTGDGTPGHPENAPYDRVMCTASAVWVPYSWVEQTRPGGRIVLPFAGSLRRQAFVCLTIGADGTAHGRFDSGASIMRLRTQRDEQPRWRVVSRGGASFFDEHPGDVEISTTTALPEEPFTDDDAGFAVGLLLPDCQAARRPTDGVVLLSHSASESWATVLPAGEKHRVYHQGPRRLWEDLEMACQWWVDAGRPKHTRFGMTVTPTGEWFWLDSPDNPLPPIGEPAD